MICLNLKLRIILLTFATHRSPIILNGLFRRLVLGQEFMRLWRYNKPGQQAEVIVLVGLAALFRNALKSRKGG